MVLKDSGNIISHTTGPKYLKDNFPIYSELTFGMLKVFFSEELRMGWNKFFIISGHKLYFTLNISIATNCYYYFDDEWLLIHPLLIIPQR